MLCVVRVTRTPAKSATHGVGIKVYERTNAPGHTGPSVFGCDGAFASSIPNDADAAAM